MQASPKLRVQGSPAFYAAAFCVLYFFGILPSAHAASLRTQNFSASQLKTQFAIADFDGDSRPDLATVHVADRISDGTRYLIAFQLSTGLHHTLRITAPTGGVQISSRDVNGDTFADVVITTAWTNLPVAVLINDGKGNFTPASPSNFPDAFRISGSSCGVVAPETKDAVDFLLTSHVIPDCELADSRFSPFHLVKLLPGHPSNALATSPATFFSGRAPPLHSAIL